ncbi:MAG: hypothetical protein IPP90_20065 [Gemmatimonadaceae bacterium]|nr:hypothetical protein [Gemmatimonadaceae bacterium]
MPERPADGPPTDDTVAGLANVYLGNILYALEKCALSLDLEGKPLDAAFYRGIGRKLAESRGRSKRDSA